VARRRREDIDELRFFAPRVPFKPMQIAAIAAEDDSPDL
jgi:hypothetical protein